MCAKRPRVCKGRPRQPVPKTLPDDLYDYDDDPAPRFGRPRGSPNLLTGTCYCGNCGGAMTLRTGKNGRYRYYACSIKARQGETGCKDRAILWRGAAFGTNMQ